MADANDEVGEAAPDCDLARGALKGDDLEEPVELE